MQQQSQTNQAQQSQPSQPTYDAGKLLEEVLARTPSERYKIIDHALGDRIEKLEELLPDKMKGQGARLVKRAMLTFSKAERLQKCTAASFIRCVLEAAELGLAIDGKLAHAVPYKDQATFQIDYKGLIQVAKRGGSIKDCYGDVVRKNDVFLARRVNGGSEFEHSYPPLGEPRGEVVGAYAIIVQPDGWRYELMDVGELDKIRGRSKAFQSGNSSPWTTDPDQMRIKTVMKRGLKLYCDDPAVVRALELDDEDYEAHHEPTPTAPPIGRVNLRKGNGQANRDHTFVREPEPEPVTLPETLQVDADAPPPEPDLSPPEPSMVERLASQAKPVKEPETPGPDVDICMGELTARIQAAKSVKTLTECGAEMTKQRAWLGETRYGTLLAAYQAKYATFQGQKPKKEREQGEDG